ncbi:signal peptidase I [Candidatus Enterococcus moelleringii]|uniref:signal peptidase I n=1 Tax=Candidatus Enterococcus moelleringii TaxID=2815325 RepID=UPI00325BA6A5
MATYLGCYLLFFGFFRTYHWLYPKYSVMGESMNPTFWEEEVVQVKAHHSPRRFDVVVLHPPNDPEALYLKRVVGLPGERLDYQDGQLFVNGKPVTDEFAEQTEDFVWEQVSTALIPEDHYFVLGDNRAVSMDSRSFGFVSEKQILGIIKEGNSK